MPPNTLFLVNNYLYVADAYSKQVQVILARQISMLTLRRINALYTDHAALSLEKQLALGEVIGDRDFSFDADAGRLGFGEDLTFAMQVLGSVSRQSNTWLWAWASSQPMPPALLKAANQLRDLGETFGMEELTEDGFEIVAPPPPLGSLLDFHQHLAALGHPAMHTPLDGHMLAMLAAGVCQADAYYGADYGRGIAYVLLPQVPAAAVHRSDAPTAMATVFARVVQLPYLLDHRQAFTAYLGQKGYQTQPVGAEVRGTKEGRTLAATFDHAGRVIALEADGAAISV